MYSKTNLHARIKSLEDKLAKFKSEREKAEQQLTQTINQLQKLEQIVGERV
jgi:prefoldin subunit 5